MILRVLEFASRYRPKLASDLDILSRRLFKAGAAVLLLLGLVHSASLFERLQPANETEKQLLDLMTNYRFDLVGSHRRMSDLLQGFSASFMVSALGLGVLDLVLSREGTTLLRRVALINAIWLAAMTALSLRYFFVVPTCILGVAFLIFASAWITLRSAQAAK